MEAARMELDPPTFGIKGADEWYDELHWRGVAKLVSALPEDRGAALQMLIDAKTLVIWLDQKAGERRATRSAAA